jgi:hypothetical protein
MTHKPTQQQRVLEILQALQGEHDIPEEFIRRHPTGDGISARYFKQVMLISECNGRISELRAKGYDIETSKEEDLHGFKFHRLKPTMTRPDHLKRAAELCKWFDAYQPTN